MKTLICVAAQCAAMLNVHAGEAYGKTVYKGKNWSVIQVSAGNGISQCALRSAPNYLEPGVPKYGSVFLEVSYPSKRITLSGEDLVMYFKISKRTTLRVGQGASANIIPEVPTLGEAIIDSMQASKNKAVQVEIDFGTGDPSIHIFPLAGFADAYRAVSACAGRGK
ncbi:hypothetical protein ACFDR9_000508 [Janthinobacterium sp. CG_23.3]|uniref:hypothetical protein n=1 Tax=Janthinobacterium sp. CG_23.3 TaxID=3349634 RepID=UPI0038D4C558